MEITDVRTFLVNANLPERPWIDRPRGRNWLFIKVYTDEGTTGVGEAGGWPYVTNLAINELKPFVIGEDPFDVEKIWYKLHNILHGHGVTGVIRGGAIGGIDMALWDIIGKQLKVPIYKLLGGKCRSKIRLYTHAANAEVALTLVEQGYTVFKVSGRDMSTVRVVKDIRDTIGYEIDVAVDCGARLTPKAAISFAKKLERYEPLWLEDPTPPESHITTDPLAKVANSTDIPLMSGEYLFNKWSFSELLNRNIVDLINPEITRLGISEQKKICALAESHYVLVSPHDGSAGPVAKMANVHLMTATPNFLILEHQAAYPIGDPRWRDEVVMPPLEVKDGFAVVADRIGLGIELNEEEIEKHLPLQTEALRYRSILAEDTWVLDLKKRNGHGQRAPS